MKATVAAMTRRRFIECSFQAVRRRTVSVGVRVVMDDATAKAGLIPAGHPANLWWGYPRGRSVTTRPRVAERCIIRT